MDKTVNHDAEMATRVVRAMKIVVTLLAIVGGLVMLAFGTYSSIFEQREVGDALGSLAFVLVMVLGIGILWAILMLPLWLIGAYLAKQSTDVS